MTQIAEQLLSQAMSLSEQERADLAARLLDTLDDQGDADYAPAWEAELQQRIAQLDSGAVQAVPWQQARQNIRQGGTGHAPR
jgi:putative addiction module component (TIGR02574 family)